ncbi:hypothetical protein VTK56DRAFT_8546 [Thermocarpiscus australiensis]
MTTEHGEHPTMGQGVEPATVDVAQLENGTPAKADWRPGRQEYAVMLTLAFISLMVALDATILVSVLPTLALDLGGTATDAFWAGTSYLLSCAVCQPFIAALSDIFGRKEMLIVSMLFFTLGTVLCAPVAKNFTVFFVGRSVQGIGGGGIITMGQVIFADIVPLRQRPKYFSFVLAAWALGSVIGPLIGGLFVEHVIWAWCFYINFPFCALGLLLVPIYVKLTTEKTSLVSKLCRVDWIGGFLFISSMTSFLVGISWAGIQFEWSSVQAITPIVVGVVGVIIAILWEWFCASEPFLRPSLFCSTSAIATYACALFQGFILFCALYYIPFYFTAIKFEKPTQSGLDIFPVTCFLLPGSIVISLATTRIGRYRWAIWSGWVITSVGCGLLALFDKDTKTPVWAVILAIFGIGHGMLLTSVNVGIQAVSRVEDAGRAAAMYAFMRTLGMSIGVAIGGTVFQNLMGNKLTKLGLPASIAHDSEAFVKTMSAMAPTDPTRIAAIQGYTAGFHGVYWTITGAAIASLVISLFIKQQSMDKLLETKFVLKGARQPNAPVMVGAETPVGIAGVLQGAPVAESRTTESRTERLSKDSPVGSPPPSAFDIESAYSATQPSEGSEAVSQDSQERSTHSSQDTATTTSDEEAPVTYHSGLDNNAVPLEILPHVRTRSRAGSIGEAANEAGDHERSEPANGEAQEPSQQLSNCRPRDQEQPEVDAVEDRAVLAPAWTYEDLGQRQEEKRKRG